MTSPAHRREPSRPVIRARAILVAVLVLVLAACSGPLLANAPVARPAPPAPTPAPTAVADPVPLAFPRDDGPHDRLTEWWYCTGHLDAADGRRFGYELVVFRAERGAFPVSWASHLAVTDESGGRFAWAQRAAVGPGVDRSPRRADGEPTGFDLSLPGASAAETTLAGIPPWTLAGSNGRDDISAALSPAEATTAGVPGGLALELGLTTDRPPVLHGRIGWIDFGPAGSSYYYSRTRLETAGSIVFDGETIPVRGTSWFDHQWGDFIAVGGGGWDWFAVNLDDGTDLTLSLVRAADGTYPLACGTLVAADGSFRHLDAGAFGVEVTGSWTSPRTGAAYPAGWIVRVPGERLEIRLSPTVADQELDTRATTGVVYWEGSQQVRATRAGVPLGGRAYVELTGYAAAATPGAAP